MEVSQVKEKLGKEVYYKHPYTDKYEEYILTAYIYRKRLKDKKHIKQLELTDIRSNNSVVIAPIEEVRAEK